MAEHRDALPWGAMLRAACDLGVMPDAFWRLSLKEWRMLTRAPGAEQGMARRDFDRLIVAWPDDGRAPND